MTAIPTTHKWIHPVSLLATVGRLFTFSHSAPAASKAPRKARPARCASYYEAGLIGRERFRL